MKNAKIKAVSSLAKVFPAKEPEDDLQNIGLSAFRNETVSFQCAYYAETEGFEVAKCRLIGSLAPYAKVRKVYLMPSAYSCPPKHDEGYLSKEPGMFPDLLRTVPLDEIPITPNQWHSLWIHIEPDASRPVGAQELALELTFSDGTRMQSAVVPIMLYPQTTVELPIYHTEWFHADCLADYYQVEVWSKEHWQILKNFFQLYVKRGMNTILTPAFTPPLDTEVGRERTNVQLVGVTRSHNTYEFDFTLLRRWFDLCRLCGIENFEMAHLFTQWGAKAAPNIMAETEEGDQRIFGWETDAKGEEYQKFLKEYLTKLVNQLDQWGMEGHVFFHLSDEPEEESLEDYAAARRAIASYIGSYPIIDAISHYSFYEAGIVDKPIPSIDRMAPFLEHKVPGLWTYYCCAQTKDVSNRFFALPSSRNRILGVQLYLYEIAGFLQWGFNFYNSCLSRAPINPYATTDANGAFPSGDPFLVYPGPDGCPEESIRIMVLAEAMQDLRALQTLEQKTSKAEVHALIHQTARASARTNKSETIPITLEHYPTDPAFLLTLRSEVNQQLSKLTKKDSQ